MFKNMNLGTKLSAAFLAVGIIPFAVLGIISLLNSSGALTDQAFGQLEGMREVKKAQINNFFTGCKGNMDVLMETVANFRQAAFEKLSSVQEIKKAQVEKYFQKVHSDITVISKNVAVVDALNGFGDAVNEDGEVDKNVFNWHNSKYGTSLKQFKEAYGYYDLLLISKYGRIVYSYKKESDLGQNLVSGPLKTSHIAECFQNGLKGVAIQDFEPYPPSNNQHIFFVMAPLSQIDLDTQKEEVLGVVALKLSSDAINNIVQIRGGMGKTGETFLVGKQDGKTSYRSDRIVEEGKIGQDKSGDEVDKALSGESGTEVKTGSSGNLEVVSYDQLKIPGLNWAMISTMRLEEVISPKLQGGEEDYFAKYIKKYGYRDLYLIHPKGEVFYSVAHEADYGTNMISGSYANSGLGKLVQKVLETGEFGFADISPYEPSEGVPSAFVARPLIHQGEIELVVALQIPIDVINAVMHERSGMGETGETYLVGPDKLMRSDSYSDPENYSVTASFTYPEKGSVDTEASREALSGKTARDFIINYDGRSVLTAYSPLNVWDTTWALIAEIDEAEALAPVNRLKWLTGMVAIIGIAAILVMGLLFARYLIKPINGVVATLKDIAEGEGNLASRLEHSSNDEIGELARWFNTFIEKLQGIIKDIAAKAQILNTSSTDFSNISSQMSNGAEQMSGKSNTVATSAEEMSSNMNSVASSMEQTATNINMVATSAEEMTSTINEIARNSEKARAITGEAVAQTEGTSARVEELGQSAQEIGKVTETINEISDQTNLLALNATIEAARAGEAGKGFAVVANEIKQLARQTADATQEIKEKIEGIQGSATGTVKEITQILKVISDVNEIVTGIASAVEEQSVTTREIAANVSQASQGIHEVNENVAQSSAVSGEIAKEISEVNQAVVVMSEGSSKVKLSSEELSKLAEELQVMVIKFKV